MIITIARQSGCSGKQVGQLLAELYLIPLYDKDALIDMAQKTGLYESIPNFFSETPVNSLLYSIAAGYGEYDALQVPVHALQNLIGEQDCVVIGRCSNYAFQNRPDSVRIFLSADRDVRVQNLENWKKISKRKAERLLADTDNNRKEFHKYYTNQIWGQAEYYDLCLNISSLGVEGTARVIEAYIAEKHLEK